MLREALGLLVLHLFLQSQTASQTTSTKCRRTRLVDIRLRCRRWRLIILHFRLLWAKATRWEQAKKKARLEFITQARLLQKWATTTLFQTNLSNILMTILKRTTKKGTENLFRQFSLHMQQTSKF